MYGKVNRFHFGSNRESLVLLITTILTLKLHVKLLKWIFALQYRYNLLVIGSEGGLIEPIVNAISLHQIKKQKQDRSLLQYFNEEFGKTNSEKFLNSQKNFVESCAAYCLICYFTQVKDRYVFCCCCLFSGF